MVLASVWTPMPMVTVDLRPLFPFFCKGNQPPSVSMASQTIIFLIFRKIIFFPTFSGEVLNVKQNNDGFKAEGITFPSMAAQRRLMEETYREIDVDPTTIGYIEAHMTGTAAGDPVESAAIASVFCKDNAKEDPLLIGCLKSNMGHSEGASGLCAITKACLIIKNKIIPPNIGYKSPNPNITSLVNGQIQPVLVPTAFKGDKIALSCFGFGGSNVHVVLKVPEHDNQKDGSEKLSRQIATSALPRLIAICSRSREMANEMSQFLRQNPDSVTNEFLSLLHDVASIDPAKGFHFRTFMIMNAVKEVIKWETKLTREKKPLVLVLPGFLISWNGISRSLLSIAPFKESIAKSNEVLTTIKSKSAEELCSNQLKTHTKWCWRM